MTITTAARMAVVAVTVLLASACGTVEGVLDNGVFARRNEFTEQNGLAIAQVAFKEMRDVSSLRLLGTTETSVGTIRVDIRMDESNCAGTFDTSSGGRPHGQESRRRMVQGG